MSSPSTAITVTKAATTAPTATIVSKTITIAEKNYLTTITPRAAVDEGATTKSLAIIPLTTFTLLQIITDGTTKNETITSLTTIIIKTKLDITNPPAVVTTAMTTKDSKAKNVSTTVAPTTY